MAEPPARLVAWWIAAVIAAGVTLVVVDPHPSSRSSPAAVPTAHATTTAPTTTSPEDLASLLVDFGGNGYALAPDFPTALDLETVAGGRSAEGTDQRRQELTADGFGRGVTAVWWAGDGRTTAAVRIYEFGSEAGADRFYRFDKRNAVSAATATFLVTTVPSAFGYGYDEERAEGGTYPVQQVIFAKGIRVFVVRVNGVNRGVDAREAITLAERQFAAG